MPTFYSTVGFADYPPGYFYILAVVGHLWHLLFAAHDGGYAILRSLVKLPAILADLGVGALIYAIAARFASKRVALGAAALYLLNPATIYISALWGQVDSISGGLALFAIYALLRSEDDASQPRREMAWIVLAWLAFAYSLLIKPQAAVLLPLLVAFAFVNPQLRRNRLDRQRRRHYGVDSSRTGRGRAVSSEQSGRGARLALRALCIWLERLSFQ